MKNLNIAVTCLLAGSIVSFSAQASDKVQLDGATIGHWTMDFTAASKLAAEKSLPMMLNFTGSDWCGWCKLMDKGVFSKDEWKQYAAENALLVTIDFPKDKSIVPEKYLARNEALRGQFGVGGYPTYVILDSDGETVLGQLAAGKGKTPESFIKEFQGVVKMSPAGLLEYAKKHPDKIDAFKEAISKLNASKKSLTEWIATRPQRNDENNTKFEAFNESIRIATEALAKF
jgi:protein disulfide-isomerase